MYTSEFPVFYVTVDVVVLCLHDDRLHALVIRRGNEPFVDRWALPGGFVDIDEDLPDAAERELAEETGLRAEAASLTQLGAYGAPGRDPRYDRVVSIGWWARVAEPSAVRGASDAAHASWEPVDDLLAGELAFDHARILRDAVAAAAAR